MPESSISERKIDTYPYPPVDSPELFQTTFGTSYRRLSNGKYALNEELRTQDENWSPFNVPKKLIRLKENGKILDRPTLGTSQSLGDLRKRVTFRGPNFQPPNAERQMNHKSGTRLSKCYDNVSAYGEECWKTDNGNYGSVFDPDLVQSKRHGLTGFELMMFLPDHPHWKDRDQLEFITPKSTGSDIGEFYDQTKRVPEEFRVPRKAQRMEYGGKLVM